MSRRRLFIVLAKRRPYGWRLKPSWLSAARECSSPGYRPASPRCIPRGRCPTACSRRTARPEVLAHLVDPHEAGLNGGGGAVRGREVIGPDRGGEAVFHGVHLVEHGFLVRPFEHRQNGTRNLLARDAVLPGDGYAGRYEYAELG